MGWNDQGTETFQFTGNPIDPIWGMKVRQLDCDHPSAWGGIKAWSTSEINYLLRYHDNEFRGDPGNYIDGENTYSTDDVLWTRASTSGSTALRCGPTIFLH